MSQIHQPESGWREHARCVVEAVDPRIFDGVRMGDSEFSRIDYSAAKAFCAQCPVRQLCLADGIANDESACVRGALTPDEYRALKPDTKRRSISLKRKPVLV